MRMPMEDRNLLLSKATLITLLLFVSTLSAPGQSDESRSDQCRVAGQNLSNSWSQPAEHSISLPTSIISARNECSQRVAMFLLLRLRKVTQSISPTGEAVSSQSRKIAVRLSGLTKSPITMALVELSPVSVPR